MIDSVAAAFYYQLMSLVLGITCILFAVIIFTQMMEIKELRKSKIEMKGNK